ncbi:subtilisin SUB4 [Toxoplasma gondii VAND]|uniref:subtilisin n=1 Tax=Toxoplasma gondii VAND TaxID=933077 RepID=A0A086Q3X3_TOXGO|nr:subtilisin SUB4 [Toxoplasma gondii VAND]
MGVCEYSLSAAFQSRHESVTRKRPRLGFSRWVFGFLLPVFWSLSSGSSAAVYSDKNEFHGPRPVLLRQPFHSDRAEYIRFPMSVQGDVTEDNVEAVEEISRQIAREVHLQQLKRKRQKGKKRLPSASDQPNSKQPAAKDESGKGEAGNQRDPATKPGTAEKEARAQTVAEAEAGGNAASAVKESPDDNGGNADERERGETQETETAEPTEQSVGGPAREADEEGDVESRDERAENLESSNDSADGDVSSVGGRLIIGLTEITFPTSPQTTRVGAEVNQHKYGTPRGADNTQLSGFAYPPMSPDSEDAETDNRGRTESGNGGETPLSRNVFDHAEAVREAKTRLQSDRLTELGIVKEMKVLENVGLVVLELNDDLSEDAIRETIKTLWQRNPSTWLIESDSEVTFRGRDEFASGDLVVVPDVANDAAELLQDVFHADLEFSEEHKREHPEKQTEAETEPLATGLHDDITEVGEAAARGEDEDLSAGDAGEPEVVVSTWERNTVEDKMTKDSEAGGENTFKRASKEKNRPFTPLYETKDTHSDTNLGEERKRPKFLTFLQENEETTDPGKSDLSVVPSSEIHAKNQKQSPRSSSPFSSPKKEREQERKGTRRKAESASIRISSLQAQEEYTSKETKDSEDTQIDYDIPKTHPAGILKPATGIVPLSLYEAVDSAVRESVSDNFSSGSPLFRSDVLCPSPSSSASESSHQRSAQVDRSADTSSKHSTPDFSQLASASAPSASPRSPLVKGRGNSIFLFSGPVRHLGKMPNDSLFSRQWAYHEPRVNVRAVEAWNMVYAHRLSRSANSSASAGRRLADFHTAEQGEASAENAHRESANDEKQKRSVRREKELAKEPSDLENPNGKRKGAKKEPIIVAVIDTGVDYNHEDLRTQMWRNEKEIPNNGIDDDGNGYVDDIRGYDFEGKTNDPMDSNGHGTHVAGIIAAAANNRRGIAGVNWEVKVMPLKFISRSSAAAEAIDYSLRMGAKISTNSWGYTTPSEGLRLAIERTAKRGQLFVAAVDNAGKDNSVENDFPPNWGHDTRTGAGFKSLLRVANLSPGGIVAASSNWSPYTVDVAAPGTDIISTIPTGRFPEGYGYKTGTSMATPLAAGVAAMVWSAQPNMTAAEVRECIMRTSTKMRSLEGRVASSGVVNAYAAVLDALGEPVPSSALNEDVTEAPSPGQTVFSFLGGNPGIPPSASSVSSSTSSLTLSPAGGPGGALALSGLDSLVASMAQLLNPFNRLLFSS